MSSTRPASGRERGYTDAQIRKNVSTHTFRYGRCVRCDCRPGSLVEESPCGDEPPRVDLDSPGVLFDPRYPELGI